MFSLHPPRDLVKEEQEMDKLIFLTQAYYELSVDYPIVLHIQNNFTEIMT